MGLEEAGDSLREAPSAANPPPAQVFTLMLLSRPEFGLLVEGSFLVEATGRTGNHFLGSMDEIFPSFGFFPNVSWPPRVLELTARALADR